MSVKTAITCDRCGSVILMDTGVTVRAKASQYDLCAECAAKFEKWLDGEPVRSEYPGGLARTASEWAKAENSTPRFVRGFLGKAKARKVRRDGLVYYDLDTQQQADLHNAVVAGNRAKAAEALLKKSVKADRAKKAVELTKKVFTPDKPKKKAWWTVQDLMKELGLCRETVQQRVRKTGCGRRMIRDSRTHWWYEYNLKAAQIAELKKNTRKKDK